MGKRWNDDADTSQLYRSFASEVTVRNLDGEVLRTEPANNAGAEFPYGTEPQHLGRKGENRDTQDSYRGSKVG